MLENQPKMPRLKFLHWISWTRFARNVEKWDFFGWFLNIASIIFPTFCGNKDPNILRENTLHVYLRKISNLWFFKLCSLWPNSDDYSPILLIFQLWWGWEKRVAVELLIFLLPFNDRNSSTFIAAAMSIGFYDVCIVALIWKIDPTLRLFVFAVGMTKGKSFKPGKAQGFPREEKATTIVTKAPSGSIATIYAFFKLGRNSSATRSHFILCEEY